MKIVSCNSNRDLAESIAQHLDISLTPAMVKRFADQEISVEIQENIRGSDVFVVQSTSAPANDHLMELLLALDALRRASCRRVTAVIPYFEFDDDLAHTHLSQAGGQSNHASRRTSSVDHGPARGTNSGIF